MDNDASRWLREHPTIEVTTPSRPEGDWRDEAGYGWVAKFWFRNPSDARAAKAEIGREGWTPSGASALGRKIRVSVTDGHDGQKLAEFVLERRPDVRRIQLRCD